RRSFLDRDTCAIHELFSTAIEAVKGPQLPLGHVHTATQTEAEGEHHDTKYSLHVYLLGYRQEPQKRPQKNPSHHCARSRASRRCWAVRGRSCQRVPRRARLRCRSASLRARYGDRLLHIAVSYCHRAGKWSSFVSRTLQICPASTSMVGRVSSAR